MYIHHKNEYLYDYLYAYILIVLYPSNFARYDMNNIWLFKKNLYAYI